MTYLMEYQLFKTCPDILIPHDLRIYPDEEKNPRVGKV